MSRYAITEDGFEMLQKELQWIRNHKLPEMEKKLQTERNYGQVSKDTREERDWFRKRIDVLQHMLDTAEIIESK